MENPSQAGLRAAYGQALETLRTGRAATAERQLRAIQAAAPGELNSLHLLGVALLVQGKVRPAIETLERIVVAAPDFAYARTDLARAYRQDGRLTAAREKLRRALKEAPSLDAAWLAYGDVLVDLEKYADARFAFEQARLLDPHRQRIEEATAALVAGDGQSAESIFRDILKADASHVAALCGLAAISLGAGNTLDSERLLRHALKQTAHSPLARRGLSHTLLAAFEEAARLNPTQVRLRLSIGHIHKTLGRRHECEQAYHECLRMDPGLGEAYWSLADLKTYVFSDAEIAAMQELLAGASGDDSNKAQLHFARGRALEQKKQYQEAFIHYAAGNALRRGTSPFAIANFEAKSNCVAACFDSAFFAERTGAGFPAAAPIFIVGLPRSGSTLIEQILVSHSRVEGTMELPNILTMVREFDHLDARGDGYPESVRAASTEKLAALGRRYLDETRPLRGGRPHFIDKMPNNFSHIALIQAILPNATIIDARRHPIDSCFSTYKQHFSERQSFSYDLDHLGRYYRSYLALMDHWDEVLPGRVMHLQYEELIRDPEANIRRLLAHCGLPFEAACLSFHETRRPVRTASSEQVRQPLYASGVGYWQHFAQELEPLKVSRGDSLERFTGLG